MEIRIDSSSGVPIRQQLAEQIVFLIATEHLKAGDFMPSVRELARRLRIHHNTVSEAYQDLVRREWLVRRRGSRLAVLPNDSAQAGALALDDLINVTIRVARASGYSMQALRQRVRDRLFAEPPDHILVIEQDPGLRALIKHELQSKLDWPIETCSRDELKANPGLVIGALAVTPQHAVREVDPLLPKDRPVVPVTFSGADEQVRLVSNLRKPSVVAVVSASEVFIKVARSVLASAIGDRHELREVLLTREDASVALSADLVFCDSIARRKLRSAKAIEYRLLPPESTEYVATAMKSYEVR
jgi:DNA-binding transcriptional regulator YhcF (GntR family)